MSIHPDTVQRLQQIHSKLKIAFGRLQDEYPEQLMATQYVNPDDRVLEIGGNIGRNSCVIASILTDSRNLTVLESNPKHAVELTYNRDQNGMSFHIIASALSKRRLIQKGWDTRPLGDGEAIPAGWQEIATITWADLTRDGAFNTLVADCEGALFYIMQDEPEFLRDFRTVVMENDYHDITHKQFVDAELTRNGFAVVYSQAGGWGPCYGRFFEVWQRAAPSKLDTA